MNMLGNGKPDPRLRAAGLRQTRQRRALANRLFAGGNRHVTAEELHAEVAGAGIGVSLATVYNVLRQFTEAGLLRQVVVEAGRTYFDTNVTEHHHFFHEDSGRLEDIPDGGVELSAMPSAPSGKVVRRVDIVIRVTDLEPF